MKIILDTNVISELIQPRGSNIIREWLTSQNGASLYTTSITQAEILYGIQMAKKQVSEECHANWKNPDNFPQETGFLDQIGVRMQRLSQKPPEHPAIIKLILYWSEPP